ncbi:MAG TPA: hypothetical protein VGF77_16835 [Allosphingosinicella sp.]|jgi:hypothetical protein
MVQSFTTLFDIKAAGGIPPYSSEQIDGYLFGFAVAAAFVVVLTLFSKQKDLKRLIVLPVLAVGVAGYLLLDFWDRHGAIHALSAGRLNVVQGCVSDFQTNAGEPHSTKNSIPDETWRIGGDRFGYKNWSELPGYHRMEAREGVVHKGQFLRVSYLVSPVFGRKEIMKIELGARSCG